MKRKVLLLLTVLAILLVPAGTAFAQDPVLEACTGDNVSGTVVAVDEETGVITVEDEDGNQCTITPSEDDYDHPVTSILNEYFGKSNTDDIVEAIDTLKVCAVYDAETDTWTTTEVAEDETCDGTEVTVSTVNEDGTFTALDENGDEVVITFDEEDEAAAELAEALDALKVDWDLNEDGEVAEVGDDIAAYHEDGVGYGVLVKLYAIAAESQEACEAEAEEGEEAEDEEEAATTEDEEEGEEGEEESCGITVEELIAMLEDGVGLGKLFQLYGKPAMLGVGQVKQAVSGSTGDVDSGDTGDDDDEACKSGGGHDAGTHTGHVDCVNEGGDGGGDKGNNKDDGDDD